MNELNLSDEVIFDRLKKCILSFAWANGQHLDEVKRSDNLKDDLGFDSLNVVELSIRMGREFGVDIGNSLETAQTVDDVVRRLKTVLERDSE